MKTKYIVLLFALMLTAGMKAQLSVNYSVGYGSYKMSDMGDVADKLPSEMINSLGLDIKLTDKFPGSVTHNASVTYTINEHEFGLQGGYLSTGAKYVYSDYSGKMNVKLMTNAYKIGLTYKHHFAKLSVVDNPLTFFFELSPSALVTDVKLKMDTKLAGGEHQKEKETISSSNFGLSIQPMLGARIKLWDHVLLHTSAGYDFEFITKINNAARVEWSGFRMNAGIGYMF